MFDQPRYRPLAWAVSLPLVVAAVWVALVLLAQHHRHVLIAQLSDIAAHGNTGEAAAAVRQLSRMPDPPVDLLVAAATSPTRGVAVESQLAINNLVRRWHHCVKVGKDRQHVADQLTDLVDALAIQHAAFSIADYPWLGRITRRILRVANDFPTDVSVPLTPQCETILAAVDANDAAMTALASAPIASPDDQLATGLSAPGTTADARVPRPFAPHTGSLDALGDDARGAGQGQPIDDVRSEIAFALPPDPPAGSAATPYAGDNWSTDGHLPPDARQPLAADGSASGDGSMQHQDAPGYGWRPRSQPMTDDALSIPISPTPVSVAPADAAPTQAELLAPLETRVLLARWLSAEAPAAMEIERELSRRGFGRLPAELVERLISPDDATRCALVGQLLAQPGVDARPWLVLLSKDESADVRLAAVSVMATSRDPQLIEQAWEVVLHDRDPRIADLAPRLRARQTGRQSR